MNWKIFPFYRSVFGEHPVRTARMPHRHPQPINNPVCTYLVEVSVCWRVALTLGNLLSTSGRDMLLSFPQRDKPTPSKFQVEVAPLNPATMLDALLLNPGGFKFAWRYMRGNCWYFFWNDYDGEIPGLPDSAFK